MIAEAAKWNLVAGHDSEMFFWRSKSQAEIDLLVRRDGKMRAFEIKWGTKKRADMLSVTHTESSRKS